MNQVQGIAVAEEVGVADGPTYKVNVLDRSISVLRAFTIANPHMTLAEISRAAGLHRSTALRLLSTLSHSGLVVRDEDTGRYSLGYEIIAMAEVARAGSDLRDWARPVMRDIRNHLNETVVLSVRTGDFRVDIDQVVAKQSIRRVVTLGEKKLLTFGAASLSILAGLPANEVAEIVDRLRVRTLELYPAFDEALLGERLARIREVGCHEQRSQYGPGTWSGSVGIAGPIFGQRGEVVAALGVSVPSARMTEELRADVCACVRESCAAIRARIGGAG